MICVANTHNEFFTIAVVGDDGRNIDPDDPLNKHPEDYKYYSTDYRTYGSSVI